jgi:hypothetical protein
VIFLVTFLISINPQEEAPNVGPDSGFSEIFPVTEQTDTPAAPAAEETWPSQSTRRALEAAETSPDKHGRDIMKKSSSQLFNTRIWDSDVSLFISGYWKTSLSLNWGISSSPLGTRPDSNDSPLLFTQEADLTLSLWLWEKYFLEVSFIDDYDLNTYRAGYQGFPGETVQYVGIGNTGLDFPIFPYLDLGGDSPSSLGIYGRFGSDQLTFHTLIRYDAAAREERTFVGSRERNFSSITPDHPLRGRSFVLPDENIPSIPVVYLEDNSGPLSGGGRRWRLANPSEYAVSASYGVVELVREHSGMVAVSYPLISLSSPYTPGLGSYTTDGYLKKVQEQFDDTRADIRLEEYPHAGASLSPPGIISISGTWALVIYEAGTFSPFERQSRYMAPSNNTEDAALIHSSNGERIDDFEILDASSLSLSLDQSLYVLTGDATGRNIFEVVDTSYGRNRRSPESMWPLAQYPEIYLPGSPPFTEDIRLRFTNYGAAGAYNIGTDVIPGSVQVYRGGILDSQVSYDPGSGTVTLASPVGFNEVIRISYLKRSEERRLGSLAAGVGMIYTPENSPFSAEAALGLRWNVSQEAYTEEGATSPGTVGFGGKTSWDYDNLKTSISLGLGFEQPDTTGLYRIAGMEGHSEIVLGMSINSGFISEVPASPSSPSLLLPDRASLTYRNYLQTDWMGSSTLMNINWSAPVVSSLEGPYPARDNEMGEIYVAEFELNTTDAWAGFQAPLGRDRELLEQAKAIVIPYRFYNYNTSSPVLLDVVVQFGTLAEEGSGGVESTSLIVEETKSYTTIDTSQQTMNIILTDDMRRKLQNATQMRVLVINRGISLFSGRILVAKPFIMGAGWRPITVVSGEIKSATDSSSPAITTGPVSVLERLDTSLPRTDKMKRLHESGANHVLYVEWDGTSKPVSSAGTDGRTPAIPLSDYRLLSFYLKGNPSLTGSTFHFLVSRGPDSYDTPGKTALELTMPGDVFDQSRWYTVEIDYGKGRHRVLVDGAEQSGSIHYKPGALRESGLGNEDFAGDGQSAYVAAFFTDFPSPSSQGSFSIDEICLEEPSPAYRVNLGSTLDWKHPEALINAGETEVISGLAFNTALESAFRGDPFNPEAEKFTGAQSRSQGEISILDTKLSGNLNFMASNDVSYWSAGHNISRSFGPLTISESFNTAPYDETMNHSLSLGLGTLLFGNLSSGMVYQNRKLTRSWNGSTGIRAEQNKHPGFSLDGNLNYTEKTQEVTDWMPNYAQTWAQSWIPMVPDNGSSSSDTTVQTRNARAKAGFFLNYLPVGVDLSFEGTSTVSVPMQITQSGSSAVIDVPFTLGPLRGNLRSQRNISRSIVYSGETIGDDIQQYGNSLSDTAPLWRTIPVFSLFDSNLDSAMDNAVSNYDKDSENTRFHESLGLNLFFPDRYDALSLIVPVSFRTQLDRNLEQRLDTQLDVFTINSGLGFSSINLFGAMGVYPVFRFYRNDELRHSITGIFSFPRGEDPLWRIQAEQNLGIYGFKGAELALGNTYTYTHTAATPGWIESFKLLWTVPVEKTLLSVIYNAGMSKLSSSKYFPALANLANSEYERLFRESLEFVIDKSGEHGVYSALIGHESLVRILGRLTLTGFAKLTIYRQVEPKLISFMLNFGTTLTVSF